MQSTNFEFLRPKYPDLADLGALAEQYTHPDPQSAVAKLRTFAEQIVLFVYHKHGLPKPYQCNLNDLLTATTFVQSVPKVICSKLHSLRIHGNKGAHGESVLAQSAVWLLQEAYELGLWMHLNYGGGSKADCPPFSPPSATNGTQAEPVPADYVPQSAHIVKKGDLLFSRANTTELVGATVFVFDTPPNRLLSDKLWRFVWKNPDEIEPLYVWSLFQNQSIRYELGQRAT